jgi:hypothetical protein
MVKSIEIKDRIYKVTNEEMISATEELVFEMNDGTYEIALFDDLLGHPIRNVWKILDIE